MGRKYGWLARTKRNASIDIERVWRGFQGRRKAQAERDKYLFSKSQSVGIEFGRQMLMEHKMHATKLQSEIALLLKQKADTEEEVEKLLYEVSGFETNVSHLENEMHELSKVEVETEARLTEKQRVEIRESKVRLDKEFGLMLQKIARHRETLKTKEALLQQIDRSKKLKSNELRDLERKLVVLLEEQQQSLQEIKQRQQKMNSRMIEDYPVSGGNKNSNSSAIVSVRKKNESGGGGGGGRRRRRRSRGGETVVNGKVLHPAPETTSCESHAIY